MQSRVSNDRRKNVSKKGWGRGGTALAGGLEKETRGKRKRAGKKKKKKSRGKKGNRVAHGGWQA